jgi:hypothetical protein
MFKYAVISVVSAMLIQIAHGVEQGSEHDRISVLEQQVQTLSDKLEMHREQQLQYQSDELEMQQIYEAADVDGSPGGLRFGGYGEVHANFEENGKSVFDLHRLVLYVGYEFSDWIVLNSEIELEHAFVADSADGDNGGEIAVEQLYVDFLLSDSVNARVGRLLAPIGIINQNHEPTLFLGVERPNVDTYIIPTTWSLDGAGIFGAPLGWLNYQAYVLGGLDGSQFSADEGVRDGRIKERSGLNDPAVTGRIDLYPSEEQDLRVGVSGYYGGTDNANKGGGSGTENDFGMYSADFEYNLSRLRFRGVVALGENSDPQNLPAGVGEEIFGWYLESGMSVMPDAWKAGKLAEADILPFVRYEEYDTQHKVTTGTVKDGANDRTDITVGVNFPLTYQFVLKADYQFRYSEAASDPNNLFNLGMGWAF